MQNIILFDTTGIHQEFLPLTFTRPVSDIRIGIFTIRENGNLGCREFILMIRLII